MAGSLILVIWMFLVPLLIAAMLLILGADIALYFLETKYLPRLGLSLYEMHMTLEQYETTFSSLEIFIWTYLGAVGMALLLTICFTNFFLTRSLFRHISAPLDELVAGVERIQGGNLDEPIAYDGNDEFKAACDAVDLMAAKLKAALDDEQRRQQSRKELKIFKQDLPVPEDYDADVDTDAAAAPYIVVRMTGGEIKNDDGPQAVEFSLIVCAYDEGKEREGYQDVANIKEAIVQRLCTKPYFGGAFTVLKPIVWAMQQDDTYPYYFGACSLTCTAPAMTQDTEMEELV